MHTTISTCYKTNLSLESTAAIIKLQKVGLEVQITQLPHNDVQNLKVRINTTEKLEHKMDSSNDSYNK